MILLEHEVGHPTARTTICPLGDIQWAGEDADIALDHLREHIDRCLACPNPKFIGTGDYIDFASPSNRDAFRTARLYDTARRVVDDRALQLVKECFQRILRPTKGLWLGLLSGHHFFDLRSGGNTDMELSRLLAAPYLGEGAAIISLVFRDRSHKQTVTLYAHHGCGSSVFPSGPITKLARIAPSWDCDIFLMGHQTKKAVGEYDFVRPVFHNKGAPRLTHSTRHLVGAGGWSKGYLVGSTTYVERGMMQPVALGQPLIHLRPKWHSRDGAQEWSPNITVEA